MYRAEAIALIEAELIQAANKFEPFVDNHQGYAVILEELDEMWSEIKFNPKNEQAKALKEDCLRKETVQVGAMVLRFLIDRC